MIECDGLSRICPTVPCSIEVLGPKRERDRKGERRPGAGGAAH